MDLVAIDDPHDTYWCRDCCAVVDTREEACLCDVEPEGRPRRDPMADVRERRAERRERAERATQRRLERAGVR